MANKKNREFYRGKKVFVTGHTGYKGGWLTAVLCELGAEMTGYALAAPKESQLSPLALLQENGLQKHYWMRSPRS